MGDGSLAQKPRQGIAAALVVADQDKRCPTR
jgi:hypothetical protein